MESNVIIYLFNINYSSKNGKINIKQQFVDFFIYYFINSDKQDKDAVIRFYLTLLQQFIESEKRFESPLYENWEEKMKPFLLEKYPKKSTKLFYENSDIHFIIKLLDGFRKEFGVKLEIKEKKKPEIKELPVTQEKKPNIISKKEENKIPKKKMSAINEEIINKLKGKIESKIQNFLDDFIEENKLKRANSMMSLRQSKTLSSFTTCDDSLYGDEIVHRKTKINLNQLLIIDNSELNQKKKNSKDIFLRSQKLYQAMQEKKQEEKKNVNELPILKKPKPGMKMEPTMNLFMNMIPKYREQEEAEKVNIEYKDTEKTVISTISVDLLFKKIIFENFLDKNALLMYHFCRQCFCFVNIEILFKKLFDCYKIYMNKKIPFDKLKNLIEFINILVLEMFEYFGKVKFDEMQIKLLKKFYNEIIIYLLTNYKEEENQNKNKISDNNINNDIEQGKNVSNVDSITKEEINIFDVNNLNHIDRKNLINANLNHDEKAINIFIFKNKNKISNNTKSNNKNDIKTNSKDNSKDLSKEINIEYPDFYKISKTVKRKISISNTNKLSSKYIKNPEEEIKEESSEDDLYSISDEEVESVESGNKEKVKEKDKEKIKDKGKDKEKLKDKDKDKENNKDKKDSLSEEQNAKEEKLLCINEKEEDEIQDTNVSEKINNILAKVFSNNDKILSSKDELMNVIKYMIKILDVRDKDNISQKNIIEAKSIIQFYNEIKNNKKKDLNNNVNTVSTSKMNKYNLFAKTRTLSANNVLLRSNNIKINPNIKEYFYIIDWPTEEIGNKLTQVSISLLNKINPRELYKGVFLKKEKEITSPNVCNTINNFNKLTSFIIEDIISYNSPKTRARVYEKWVQVCDYCRSIKNYNDCIAIYSALNNFIITGLSLTFKEIKYRTKSTFEQISVLCSCEANYKNIRNDMHLCEEKGITFIPYLGMILRDINFLEESFKYINQKGCINMEKIEKINDLLERYFKYRIKDENNKFSDLKKCSKELNFFDKLEVIKEEDLETIASDIEPDLKYNKQEFKRFTSIDIKYFSKKKKNENLTTRRTLGKSLSFSNFFN